MKIRFLILSVITMIIQSCAIDPPMLRLDLKVALEKHYSINCDKKSMIKKFDTNPTFINIDKESKHDTFYFDITLKDKLVTFCYKTYINQEINDSLKIEVDSLVKCFIKGKFLKGIDQKDLDYCENIRRDELIRIFDQTVINKIKESDFKTKDRVIINFME